MAVNSKLNNLVELAKEKSSDRRRTLLREVTDLFFDEPPEQDSGESAEFDHILTALAEQTVQEAREELAERFADAPQAPRGLVLKLAHDAIEVAGPILSRSTVLNDDDLVGLAESAGQTHLKAISQRENVSERVSDTIVRHGDDDTVAQLIRNDGARLSRETYEVVTERAEQSEVLQGPLVDRADTPNDLLADMMLTVGKRLRDKISERFENADQIAIEQAMAASQARLAARMEEDEQLEEARKYVRSMAVRKRLNGSLLANLLREQQKARFYVAFAELTGVDVVAARRAIDQDSVDPLALICKASDFDKALFVTLAVLRTSASSSAFADAKELGALYDQITKEDAERAMRFWRMRRDMAA